MCRLLCVRSQCAVSMSTHLAEFSQTAKNSPEDQSHGWGCAWLEQGEWKLYHSLKPVWEDRYDDFPKAEIFLAHARSAYRNEGIEIQNNMPFFDGERVFIFNGELQGVRIQEKGRIGAEKVFNFVKRHGQGNIEEAIRQGTGILVRKSRYVRAMNFIIAEKNHVWLHTLFNENSDYFQMYEKFTDNAHIISSAPYENSSGWISIENRTIRTVS